MTAPGTPDPPYDRSDRDPGVNKERGTSGQGVASLDVGYEVENREVRRDYPKRPFLRQ